MLREQFMEMDTDKNGSINIEEFKEGPFAQGVGSAL